MRIIALLASYNEARFIRHTIRHLAAQGVESYLVDNDSTDGTLELARELEGQGLIGWERLARHGVYDWGAVLAIKERRAGVLRADWFLAQDCDDFRLGPPGTATLAEGFAMADREGFNAVNFTEFTFQPVLEAPDHDHDDFLDTLRWFYPFAPVPQHRINAWKNNGQAIDLVTSGGHEVAFRGRRVAPYDFRMRHYMMLSERQALAKYRIAYRRQNVDIGWHGWRARLPKGPLLLPPARALLHYRSDVDLRTDLRPLRHHVLARIWEGRTPRFPRSPGWRWQLRFALRRFSARRAHPPSAPQHSAP